MLPFQYPQAYNDVALIRLKEEDKLSFDGKIRKICLPKETNAEPNKWFQYQINLIGYGKTRQDSISQLRTATMVVMPNKNCNEQFEKGIALYSNIRISLPKNPLIMKNQLCSGTSGFTDDAGSCAGDSGSPGVFFDYTRDAYMQVGVLHGGVTQCSSNLLPSIYTRIDEPGVLEFIKNELNDNVGKFYFCY